MKVVVFGATGGTGKQVVARALAAGHDVVAVARRPEAITTTHEKLRVAKGDVLDLASIEAALAGADAVISAFGPADNKKPGTLLSQGVAHIVDAQTRLGPKRLVFESGLMMSDGTGLSVFGRIGISVYRALNRALHDDKLLAEKSILASALDWTIVRPPALTHAPARGSVVSGVNARISPATSLSHEDCAAFLVEVAADPARARQILVVGH